MNQLTHENRWGIADVVCVAAFFSTTLLLFGQLHIYLTNAVEFHSSFLDVFPPLVGICIATAGAITLTLALLPTEFRKWIAALAFGSGVLLWLQSNILVWNYGVLDGSPLDWKLLDRRGFFDGAIWIVGLSVALYAADRMRTVVKQAALVLIFVQAISVAVEGFSYAESKADPVLIDTSTKFSFSKERNIVVLVLDAYQSDVFYEVIQEDPSRAEIFDGFTYFQDALGGYPYTQWSIPLLLTGRFYDGSTEIDVFLKEAYLGASIPRVLKQDGYRSEIFPSHQVGRLGVYYDTEIADNFIFDRNSPTQIASDLKRLYSTALFRSSPHSLRKIVYDRILNAPEPLQDRDVFVRELAEKAEANLDSPAFKHYHLQGMHHPITIGGEVIESPTRNTGKRMAILLLETMRSLLDTLKELDVYDQSMIFIVGDHGMGYGVRLPDRYQGVHQNGTFLTQNVQHGKALPLFLVKPLDSGGALKTSMAPVSLADLPATVFTALGFNVDLEGKSVFEISEDAERTRTFYSYGQHAKNAGEFFQPLEEFSISGFAWLDSSWTKTP